MISDGMKDKRQACLRAAWQGRVCREIQRTRHIAPQGVAKVRSAAEEKGIRWEDVSRMDETEAHRLLFPDSAGAEEAFIAPDFDYVHSELQKTGVTMRLLLYQASSTRVGRSGAT